MSENLKKCIVIFSLPKKVYKSLMRLKDLDVAYCASVARSARA